MFRNTFAFILLSTVTCAVSSAQTPEPRSGATSNALFGFFDSNRSYLGIETEEVTKENFAKYGLREVRGVAVEKVIEGSPAQAAGLQNGDVIAKFNDDEITSVRKLSRLIGEVAPDRQAKLTVTRNGDNRELTVTLGKQPGPKFENGSFAITAPGQTGRIEWPEMAPLPPLPPTRVTPRVRPVPSTPGFGSLMWSGSGRRIGVGVTSLTKQLSEHFGVASGIMINNVRENSPAAKAGLRAGDIIVEVDGKKVDSDFDLIRAIGEKKDGDVSLIIVRERNRQTISVTPEESKGEPTIFFETFDGGVLAPGQMRMSIPAAPAVPGTPVPLNRIHTTRRVL